MSLHLDPRMPAPDKCVQRYIIDRLAEEQPDQTFAITPHGVEWTCRETRLQTIRTANALRALGVKQGDHVLVWLPNGLDCIRVWFGINYLGAVYVPLNLAYRGHLLEHAIGISGARLAIVHADLHQRLAGVDSRALRKVVVIGGPSDSIPGLDVHDSSALASDNTEAPQPERDIAPWDLQAIMFTSGTTGPSKGVLCSYYHLHQMAMSAPFLSSRDRYMVNLPLNHASGVMPVTAMLAHGGSIGVVDVFDTEQFWPLVRKLRVTTSIMLGVMGQFLLKRPETPDDRNHTLATCTYVPFNDTGPQFNARFGVEIHTHFNMTEISMPIVSEANPKALGSAGRPRPGAAVRVVDGNDCELPPGVVGELIVRTDSPWAMNHGYAGDPVATAAAWRNGWFHTGDAFRRDAEGNFYFVDRLKDAIRRRGENISSFEVESEVLAFPPVREVAAIAAPNVEGEDEVMAVVALREGAEFEPAELIRFLIPRMAHFMVPRYVRVVESLPRTPTAKIEKVRLRKEGVTPDTWDRQQAGISVKRDKIGLSS